jgi:magnesium chelatase subunit D
MGRSSPSPLRLAALPGGGATPLAAGLRDSAALAAQARGRGLTPTLIVMTDGRANIALDGTADRARAAEDADRMATLLRAQDVPGLVIDMSVRPHPALRRMAAALDAPYLPLPRADSRAVSQAVTGALTGT